MQYSPISPSPPPRSPLLPNLRSFHSTLILHRSALTEHLSDIEIRINRLSLRQSIASSGITESRHKLSAYESEHLSLHEEIRLFSNSSSDGFSEERRRGESDTLLQDLARAVEKEKASLDQNEKLMRATQMERSGLESRQWRLGKSLKELGALLAAVAELVQRVEVLSVLMLRNMKEKPVIVGVSVSGGGSTPSSPSFSVPEEEDGQGEGGSREDLEKSDVAMLRSPSLLDLERGIGSRSDDEKRCERRYQALLREFLDLRAKTWTTEEQKELLRAFLKQHRKEQQQQLQDQHPEMILESPSSDERSDSDSAEDVQVLEIRSISPIVKEISSRSPPRSRMMGKRMMVSSPGGKKPVGAVRRGKRGSLAAPLKKVREISQIIEVGRDDQDEEVVDSKAPTRQIQLLREQLRHFPLGKSVLGAQKAPAAPPRRKANVSHHPMSARFRKRSRRTKRTKTRKKKKTDPSSSSPSSSAAANASAPLVKPGTRGGDESGPAVMTMRHILSRLLEEPVLSTVSFLTRDGTETKAHKSVLARSPFLSQTMLKVSQIDESSFHSEIVAIVVAYLYGRVEFSPSKDELWFRVLQLASKWKLPRYCRQVLRHLESGISDLKAIVVLLLESFEFVELKEGPLRVCHLICMKLLKKSIREFLLSEDLCRKVQDSNPELWFRLARLTVLDVEDVPDPISTSSFVDGDELPLLQYLGSLRFSPRYANLGLVCASPDDDEDSPKMVFPVHREIVSARCDYFRDVLSNKLDGFSMDCPFSIPDGMSEDQLKIVISFVYTASIPSEVTDFGLLFKLVEIGDRYSVEGLASSCVGVLIEKLQTQKDVAHLCVEYGVQLQGFSRRQELLNHCKKHLEEDTIQYLVGRSTDVFL